MLTDHNFGELLQAALAINLGYLALDRFRYRDAIERIVKTANAHADGMPDGYRTDKAWADIKAAGQDKGPAPNLRFLRFCYSKLFSKTWDRRVAVTAASVCIGIIALRAIVVIGSEPHSLILPLIEYFIWAYLILGIAMVAVFIVIGRNCVRAVSAEFRENLTHLGNRYKSENENKAAEMLAYANHLVEDTLGL